MLDVGDQPLLVGHSFAGVVATACASRFPVVGVVNVDQGLDVRPLPPDVSAAVRGPAFEDFFGGFFAQAHGELDTRVAAQLSATRDLCPEVLLGAWSPLMELGPAALTDWMAELMTLPEDTFYLALHGLPVDETYASWLAARIPGAVVETAPARTHYPHLADPEWFLRRVEDFHDHALRRRG